MMNGSLLQAVEFVELAVERHVRYEVERVLALARILRVLDLERVLPRERVVRSSYHLRVAYRPTSVLRWQRQTEIFQSTKFISYI